MKILVAHNRYHYRGGEDTVAEVEIALLRERGHEIRLYGRDNSELQSMSAGSAALSALWSRQTYREVQESCRAFKPDLIHAHNTFPLISPSLYSVASDMRIPVVQTLHNFRLLCPQAMLLRQGRVCEDCVGHLPWRAVVHRCYRNSAAQSALTATMLTLHRWLGTWSTRVSRYIVLNNLCREKFIRGGLPASRLRIKPNFVSSVRIPDWQDRKGGIFIGRLSAEKGITVLAEAMVALPELKIDVFGKGPMQAVVERCPGMRYGGFLTPAQLADRLHKAAWLLAPSTGVESFGLVAIEAFCCGTPVIAARHGGLGELIEHGKTGLLVPPGDATALKDAIQWAESHPGAIEQMGKAARAEYLTRYTPEHNYEILMSIYQEALTDSLSRPNGLDHAENRAGC